VIGFTGAVLTGGASRRMGADKALLDVGDGPLASIVASALRDAGATEVLAIGGDVSGLTELQCFDRVIPDAHPGEGPLDGIITALGTAIDDVVVVLACDTPQIDSSTPERLVDALHGGGGDLAMAVVGGRRQPLTAAWRASVCRERLLESFAAGERAPRRALGDLQVIELHDLPVTAVADLDRPEDLDRYAARRPFGRTADHRSIR